MRKLLFAIIGVVGVTLGVLAGILFAPRKGSETREEIVRRSKPLREAAGNAASRAGQKIQPIAKLAGDRIPMRSRGKVAAEAEVQATEGGVEDEQFGGQHSNGTTSGRHAEPERVGSIG